MTLPTQPPHMARCNGCGLCCIAEQCPISLAIFNQAQVCPALESDGSKFLCGLMVSPADYNAVFDLLLPVVKDGLDPNRLSAEAYGAIIGKGIGCDADVVTEYDP